MENQQSQNVTEQERRKSRRKEKELERTRIKRKHFIKRASRWGIGVLLVGAATWGIWQVLSQPSPSGTESDILQLKSDDYTLGNLNGKAVLIEYLDFECEACGAYYPVLKQLKEEFKDDLVMAVRYFPLSGHKNGLAAALAVEAASRQGKFWEMHDYLFEKQKEWGEKPARDDKIFERYAQDIGLNLEKFKKDRDSQSVKDRVERDRADATKLKLPGTPSFFLNGEKIQNPGSYEDFKKLVEDAMRI